jgi:hypothetical protein
MPDGLAISAFKSEIGKDDENQPAMRRWPVVCRLT